ncbi:MAG TPA: alpha/beta fold hydrolase, partial [Bacteroidales bacterium]|nr:alpha/beta fold hydrolase [Bacteroidales bacterium]
MKNLTLIIATLILVALSTIQASAQASMDYDFTITGIEFQPGEFIDINVNVYVNENATNWADHGKIFAVEGMAHTANCWKPFAEELFMRTDPELEINEFYAIDMPARGGSGVPYGGSFLLENMYLDDYLTVVEAAISYMNNEMGVYPSTIMGHSMGGLEVILLQNRLIDQGSNLRKEYKFKNAILLAPAIPAPLDWAFLTNGGSSGVAQFAGYIPGIGVVLDIPFYIWPYVFFTNSCGVSAPNMVPGAPTAAMVLENGYNSIEAGPLLYELSGMVP